MITKRTLLLGDYDTATHGWTLSTCSLSKASQSQTFVSVPGRYAPLDFSTYLTDGQPYYGNASLAAVLESAQGNRLERQERIDMMVNLLDGRSLQIVHPDHLQHYLIGRVQVVPSYNNLAHCAVAVNVVCEPWLYSAEETIVTLTASTTKKTASLVNAGKLGVVPQIVTTSDVLIEYGGQSWALSAGTYSIPEIYLTTGIIAITYSGSGTITITYREAVLAA